jgi:tRNA (pseudouridine54-N1)-methyltransferase
MLSGRQRLRRFVVGAPPMRRFVVIGREATASDDFLLDDLPGTSGRLDVGLRCVRAALLFSHGLRRDTIVYLVLGKGPRAPRVLRLSGATARFLRPDERSLAVLARKALASRADAERGGFVEVKAGIALASGGLDRVIDDLGAATPYILEQDAPDVRDAAEIGRTDAAFFVGDHLGLSEATRARLAAIGARSLSVGPISLHAEDAVAIVSNEIDRREASGRP